jgi:hypothetical protein
MGSYFRPTRELLTHTYLGGRALGHIGLIVFDSAYAIISPTGANGSTLWTNPTDPGHALTLLDWGKAAQLRAGRHSWEEDILTHRTFSPVQQALKKQIITVFEPMNLDILNYKMVGR